MKSVKTLCSCYSIHYKNKNLIAIVSLYLIEKGIGIHCKKTDGCNALHILCNNKSTYSHENILEIARILINKNIDVNSKNEKGNSVLHLLSFKSPFFENVTDVVRLF